ncbi:hypothetical protein RAH41_02590 [Gottfriedia acidiceleris]|uniref:hypothetical protein n=1 Tax=Gottfriedia acidiceleris TaxID=371036 RepID=UPI002F26009C
MKFIRGNLLTILVLLETFIIVSINSYSGSYFWKNVFLICFSVIFIILAYINFKNEKNKPKFFYGLAVIVGFASACLYFGAK